MADKGRNIKTWNAIGRGVAQLFNDLRGQILEYCRQEKKTKRDLLMMDLVLRNNCNLLAVLTLVEKSLGNDGSTYLKLPVGLLLRSCFADCIMGLYISQLSTEKVENLAQTLEEEYVASLFARADVYKDKVRDILPYDDEILEGWYTMQIEDHYLNYLEPNPDETNMHMCTTWKVEKTGKHITLKEMLKALKLTDDLNALGTQLYAYYKYFSQYEHFSEASHGDTLVDFGLDNVSFEKAIDCLRKGLLILLDRVSSNPLNSKH